MTDILNTIDAALTAGTSAPWEHEPDEQTWTDPATGYTCRILRHPAMGHLCGYLHLPAGHPWADADPEDLADVEVHGGITYTTDGDDGGRVVGFDCCHHADLVPAHPFPGGVYRTADYVRGELGALAQAAAETAGDGAHVVSRDWAVGPDAMRWRPAREEE
ncbi:hypothetical protein [Nocardiopsis composta]|uniref:Uncharacterized protein n=1 Tax=Nocardiopsis composta TaxID=157465 RepID=A0A7W8QJX6_9ACTN|nr:hypothetical protein [Nocardiopsis composta]MBB5431369.1 hypothetical protein [Nocardiopsis composta]